MFSTSADGQTTATGATIATHAASAEPRKTRVCLRPSRVTISTAATITAGQAVAFAAEARPSAIPARTNRGWRHSSAKPRHNRARMGMSVPPTASSNAITGDAAMNTVQRREFLAPAALSASQKMTRNAAPNQTRGSVITWVPNNARGMPKSDITGKYGL